ncbi:MAG: tyrosine-type recombinase/integrase [Bacteroidota bacterium]
MIEKFLRYLASEKRYSSHTITAYEADLKQLQDFLFTRFEILEEFKDVKHIHLRDWVVHLIENGNSPRSTNRKIAATKSFYKFLLARSDVETNPTSGLKPVKGDKKLPSFIRERETENLLDHLHFNDSFSDRRDQLILELLYGTGIRLAELIGLKKQDVNFYEKSIVVLGKRNKERILPVSNPLLYIIQQYLQKCQEEGFMQTKLLLTDKGNELYPMFVQRKVKYYMDKITTVSKKSPHTLRHTFATHLLNKGANLNAVKDLLGHSSLAATQVYTHNSIEKLKDSFNQAHPKA